MKKFGPIPKSPTERMWAKVERGGPDECWPFVGQIIPAGYGLVSMPAGSGYLRAHRLAWESVNGPIPDGIDIDHMCHNVDPNCAGGDSCLHRRCCNPAHLDATTRRINTLRGKTLASRKAAQTHCVNGHELVGVNLYVHRQRGTRMCRTCMVETARLRRLNGNGQCSDPACDKVAYARKMCQGHYMHWWRAQR